MHSDFINSKLFFLYFPGIYWVVLFFFFFCCGEFNCKFFKADSEKILLCERSLQYALQGLIRFVDPTKIGLLYQMQLHVIHFMTLTCLLWLLAWGELKTMALSYTIHITCFFVAIRGKTPHIAVISVDLIGGGRVILHLF